jgi:hypothetical protein
MSSAQYQRPPKGPIIHPNEPPRVSIKLSAAAQLNQKKDSSYALRLLDEAMAGTSPGAHVLPLFYPSTEEELDALVEKAKCADPKYKAVDLFSW